MAAGLPVTDWLLLGVDVTDTTGDGVASGVDEGVPTGVRVRGLVTVLVGDCVPVTDAVVLDVSVPVGVDVVDAVGVGEEEVSSRRWRGVSAPRKICTESRVPVKNSFP